MLHNDHLQHSEIPEASDHLHLQIQANRSLFNLFVYFKNMRRQSIYGKVIQEKAHSQAIYMRHERLS